MLKYKQLLLVAGCGGVIVGVVLWFGSGQSGGTTRLKHLTDRFSARGKERDVPQRPTRRYTVPPASIRTIVEAAGSANFWQRLRAVHALGDDLDQESIRKLGALLRSKMEKNAVLKNDILNVLQKQANLPPDLTAVLIDLYHDHEQNILMRDYALQHLVGWFQQLGDLRDATPASVAETKGAIKKTLWEGVAESNTSIAGTALIGLSSLAQQSEVEADKVREAAFQLAADRTASELTRIAALQVCAQMGVEKALPVAVDLVGSAPSLPLKLSAVGAIGLLGGGDQQPLVDNLLAVGSGPLQTAAQVAKYRLQTRAPN